MPAKITHINVDNLIDRHLAGESINKIAQSVGVARITLNRWFAQRGVICRNPSEAERLKWAAMTPTQRKQQTDAAHTAVRGKKKTDAAMYNHAKGREKSSYWVGRGEREMQQAFIKLGMEPAPQRAFDRYNIDIVIGDSIAVEILGCTGNPLNRRTDRHKVKKLVEAGWFVVYIQFNPGKGIASIDFDYLATLIEALSRNPSNRGKYFMIRADGKLYTPGGLDLNDIARIEASK